MYFYSVFNCDDKTLHTVTMTTTIKYLSLFHVAVVQMILLNSTQAASWWLQPCSTQAPPPLTVGVRGNVGSESVVKTRSGTTIIINFKICFFSASASAMLSLLLPLLLRCHWLIWSRGFLGYLPSCNAAAAPEAVLAGPAAPWTEVGFFFPELLHGKEDPV